VLRLGILLILTLSSFSLLFFPNWTLFPVYSQNKGLVNDPGLSVQTVSIDVNSPTGIAFLRANDMLVTEKNTGKVQRIINGQMLAEPVIDVSVANDVERGLLGIAVSKNVLDNKTYVFLYYTESDEGTENGNGNEASDIEVSDGTEEEEQKEEEGEDGGEPIGNRLYRYEFVNDKLVNPKLLLDLPYLPGPAHNGGVIAIGPDNNVYVMVGDLYSPALNTESEEVSTEAQNYKDGKSPDGRGGILRVTQDGEVINETNSILGDEHPLNMYYAYGIRNSFGIAFDPLTGNLWDTENGGRDEINQVEPGFNSGWNAITGVTFRSVNSKINLDDLVDFNDRGKYSNPELDLGEHIAPTGMVFFHSNKFGNEYENDLFVGTYRGEILLLQLGENRKKLLFEGELTDAKVDSAEELEDITFAKDLGPLTDVETGPDGFLYATVFRHSGGEVIRILPSSDLPSMTDSTQKQEMDGS
jgi:aldose sugar dehydrogenase